MKVIKNRNTTSIIKKVPNTMKAIPDKIALLDVPTATNNSIPIRILIIQSNLKTFATMFTNFCI